MDIPVRYRHSTLKEAFLSFPFKDELSFATFYKYFDKNIKKPHRKSDLCEYCEYGRELTIQIREQAAKNDYTNCFQNLNSAHLIEFFRKLNRK